MSNFERVDVWGCSLEHSAVPRLQDGVLSSRSVSESLQISEGEAESGDSGSKLDFSGDSPSRPNSDIADVSLSSPRALLLRLCCPGLLCITALCPPEPFPWENLLVSENKCWGFIQDWIIPASIPVTRQRKMDAASCSKPICQLEHLWREYSSCSTVTLKGNLKSFFYQTSFNSCSSKGSWCAHSLVCAPVLSLAA